MKIIGVGVADRGDDSVGLAVADLLGAQRHDGEPAGLIDSWAGEDHVVVVDAMRSGRSAGEVVSFDATEAPLPVGICRSTHALGLAEAVELARALGRLPAKLTVVGVEGVEFGFGSPMSDAVAGAVARVAEVVALA